MMAAYQTSLKSRLASLVVYGASIVFVAGWWLLSLTQETPLSFTPSVALEMQGLSPCFPDDRLSSIRIERAALKEALGGNYSLMSKLIADWDVDAELLEEKGIQGIQRLPRPNFLRSQLLGKALLHDHTNTPPYAQKELAQKELHRKQAWQPSFLPQTYTAASFLLALLPPSQIIALPCHLRNNQELYPRALTDQIPLDIDQYSAEKLFQKKPKGAFVARYSHPSSLKALTDQGIALYMMKDLYTLQDIADECVNVGRLVGRPAQAELMNYFLNAAILALDNKLTLINHHFSKQSRPLPKVLYVNYYNHFSIPTKKTLVGHLLQKISAWDCSLKVEDKGEPLESWTHAIDKECMRNLNPDCLIVSTEHPKSVEQHIICDPALKELKAVRLQHLYFVNESVQQSQCQYTVLAYNDLIDILARMP